MRFNLAQCSVEYEGRVPCIRVKPRRSFDSTVIRRGCESLPSHVPGLLVRPISGRQTGQFANAGSLADGRLWANSSVLGPRSSD